MSEIEIDIKGKGGAEAAKEISKPAKELKEAKATALEMRKALDAVEGEGPEFDRSMEAMEKSVAELEARVKAAEKALRKMEGGGAKAKKGSANAGRAALEASRAFEDLQFGVVGVLNNIPSLVQALGGAAGLAGAISIVAVGLNILVPKLLGTGEASKEVSEEFKKSQEKMADAAEEVSDRIQDAARKEIQATVDVVTAAGEERERLFQDQITAIDLLIAKTRELRTAELARSNAEAARDLAKVDLDEQRGEIDEDEARRRRDEIEAQADRAKDASALAALEEKVSRTESQLRQARLAQATQTAAVAGTERSVTDAEAEAAKVQALINTAEEAEAEIEGLKKQIEELNEIGSTSAGGLQGGFVSRERAAEIVEAGKRSRQAKAELEEAERRRKESIEALPEENEREQIAERVEAARDSAVAAKEEAEALRARTEELQLQLEAEREISRIRAESIRLQATLREETREINSSSEAERADERRRKEQEADQKREQATDLAGEGLAVQAEELLRKLREKSAVNKKSPRIQELLTAIEALKDGVSLGEGADLASVLESLASTLPKRLSDMQSAIKRAEIAAKKLEDRVNNQRSFD